MKIAISKASGSTKYGYYGEWLRAANPDVEIVDLYHLPEDRAVETLSDVSALVLSGGPDVHPRHYNKPELVELCGEIDEHRDAMEFAVARAAIEMNMPVLGVCRGLQVLNVLFGGTLIPDIPKHMAAGSEHKERVAIEHRRMEDADSMHAIEIESGSVFRNISRIYDGTINSAHHQAVDALASLFTPSAYSPDGIVEAFEWGDASLGGKPFLLAVQWHPERMDWSSPFSLPIAEHFTNEARAYRALFR